MNLSSPTINPESTVIGTLGSYSPGEVVEDKVRVFTSLDATKTIKWSYDW